MSDAAPTTVQSETVSLTSGTITFEVLQHDEQHHALRLTCTDESGTVLLTIGEDAIEELHRVFCRATQTIRLEARGVWKIREQHPNAFYPWTEAEQDRLRDEFGNNATVKELAARFHRSEDAIRARLMMLEINPSRPKRQKTAGGNRPVRHPDRPKSKRKVDQPATGGFVDEIAGF
jgi:hypothetical protein